MIRQLLIAITVTTVVSSTNAQRWAFPYNQYSIRDHLPTNLIYCVTSDKYGNLWLGTDAGVIKFDGFNVVKFTIADGLPSNDVFEVFCDSKDRLWVTTFKHDLAFLYRGKVYNKDNSKLIRQIPEMGSFTKVFEDLTGNLWFRSWPFKLVRLNKKNQVFNFKSNFGIRSGGHFFQTDSGLFIAAHDFILRYDSAIGTFNRIQRSDGDYCEGLTVIGDECLYINRENEIRKCTLRDLYSGFLKGSSLKWQFSMIDSLIWLPTKSGIQITSKEGKTFPKILLSEYSIASIYRDHFGFNWVGSSYYGLFEIPTLKVRNFLPVEGQVFTAIFVDRTGIYVGTNTGNLQIASGVDQNFHNVDLFKRKGLSARISRITPMSSDLFIVSDRCIWKTRRDGLAYKLIPNYNSAIKHLQILGDSLLILHNDGARFINGNTFLPIDSLFNHKRHYSYIEYNGKKIVGSQDSLFYIEDRRFIPYPLDKRFDYRAVDLLVKDSLLVATTAEGGVFFIEGNKVVRNLNVGNGFRTNTCYRSVLYDKKLFTATNLGVHVYDFSKDSLYYFFESDGLPSNNVFDLCVYSDTLYAATEGGLSVIPVSAIPHKRGFPFYINPVIISKDSLWDCTDSFSLHTDDEITFVANGLSFGTRTPVRYFYRIPAIDTAFRETTDPNISFRSLPLGRTRFEVYAMNGEGTRTPLSTLRIDVMPYFYQTNVFKFLLLFTALAGVAAAVHFSVRRAKRIEQERAALDRRLWILELDKWRSAVNPHFLFNSLNTVQALFKRNQFSLANDFIGSFSILLRRTIDQSGHLLVKVGEEVTFLKSYLEVEQMKAAQAFEFTLDIDHANLDGYFIPSLVIQPVVENSLKHGIRNMPGGRIRLEMYREGEHIRCTIADNGHGFRMNNKGFLEGSQGIGLIRKKLDAVRSLLHVELDFSYHNLTNADGKVIGAKSVFIFPFITQNYDLSKHSH